MNKKNKSKKTNSKGVKNIVEEELQSKKNNTLIVFGVIIAISSIGLLIFVLSEKVFHLN